MDDNRLKKGWLNEYPDGVPAEIDLGEYTSLADLFRRSSERYANKTALVSLGKTMSFSKLDTLSRNLASYLVGELDLKQGDRVGLMMPNILQYPVAFFAIIRAGLVVVNCDPLSSQRELRYQLTDSGCRAIIVIEDCARKLSNVVEETPIEFVITTQVGDLLGPIKGSAINFQHKWLSGLVPPFSLKGSISFCKTVRYSRRLYADPVIHPEDLALLQYTSGTEGVPKGVMLSHQNLVANVLQGSAWASGDLVAGAETMVTVLPMYHIFGLTCNLLYAIKIGACNLLLVNGQDSKETVKVLSENRFSVLVGVGTFYQQLMLAPDISRVDFSHLKVSLTGGMAMNKGLAKEWAHLTGMPLIESYGMTEASPAITINPMNLPKYNGFLGLPLPSTEVSIRDLSGNELGPNRPGEVWVKGPQIMLGYWRKPETTAYALTKDGWFRTGDVAEMCPNGYVRVIDRIRDIVNVSGFVVYPTEIESLVKTHESVEDAAVIAVPDDRSGEAVKLFVVTKKGFESDELVLMNFCRGKLSGYKCPKHIEFVDRLPRDKTGNLLRRELRKAF